MINYSEQDIDRDFARRAFYATSMVPDQRGDGYIKQYVQHMDDLVNTFEPFATDENRESLIYDLERYRVKYLSLLIDYLAAHSRCISSFITGPSNFPTRRAEKANASADKRMFAILEFQEKVQRRLHLDYNPVKIAQRPISSDEDDAITQLEAKVVKLESLQETMKAANKIVRKKKLSDEEKVAELSKMEGISEQTAWQLLQPDFCARVGVPDYKLKNNNANIRSTKKRIENLKREQDRGETEDQVINGVTVIENREMNRLQLFFPGKPPVETRKLLKSHGFRWSPSQGAWQRQLNENARWAAEQVLEN